MVDNSKEVRKQILDVVGMLAAVITVIAYLVLVINAQWPFLGSVPFVRNVLEIIRVYAPLVVVGITGLEFVANKSIIVRVIYYAAVALVVISMFLPGTWNQLVGLVK